MRRGLIALVAGVGLGLAAPVPAMAADNLATSGDATSITPTSADLNGVVSPARISARWLFEYSISPTFDGLVLSTTPVTIPGRLTAVESQVSDLTPATTYYWRVVLVLRSGTRAAQTYGATETLVTARSPGGTDG